MYKRQVLCLTENKGYGAGNNAGVRFGYEALGMTHVIIANPDTYFDENCICLLYTSFARIFYRNAINIGLPILECRQASVAAQKGDRLEVDLSKGIIWNHTRGTIYQAEPFPLFIQEMMKEGGLLSYLKKNDAPLL